MKMGRLSAAVQNIPTAMGFSWKECLQAGSISNSLNIFTMMNRRNWNVPYHTLLTQPLSCLPERYLCWRLARLQHLKQKKFSYRIYHEYLSDCILCEDGRMCYTDGQNRKNPPPCTLQAVMPQRILECYIDKPSFLLEMIKRNEKHLVCKELLTVRGQEKCTNPSKGLCPSAFSIVPKDFLNDMKEIFETMSSKAIQYHETHD